MLSHALSLPMIYRRFSLSRRRIAAFKEMGQPLNLKVVEDAAQAVAMREEEFIYHGQPDFHLYGLLNTDGPQYLTGRRLEQRRSGLGKRHRGGQHARQ